MDVLTLFKGFWNEFLATQDDPDDARARFYEACRFGHTVENANKTAQLILEREKIATGSLLAEFELGGKPLPTPGALTLVVDGQDQAVAVIQTTAVKVTGFSDIDAQFAYDYGEGDRSLGFWHTNMWRYYAEECERMGTPASEEMPIVCEYFKVINPQRQGVTH